MKPKRTLFILWLLGWGILPGPAAATKKEKLAAINSQIQEINHKMQQLKSEKSSLLNEIYKIELNYEKGKIESNRLGMQLKWVGEKIEKKRREQRRLELEIKKSNEKIKQLIRILYKVGGNTYFKLFVRINDLNQLFRNYRLFTSLINIHMGELKKVKQNMEELETVKSQLEKEQQRLRELKQMKERKLRSISGLKRQKLNLIMQINKDKKEYHTLLDELKYEAQSLKALISGKTTAAYFHIENIDNLKGKLIWPLPGTVISHFGKRKSTQFDTYIINNGIEIKPGQSDDVKAVYPGEVVFADYWKGYGNLVIIQHSKDFHSMYGHCERIDIQRGEAVNTGDIIAAAGDTGSTSGKSLYFEIRKQLQPQDPLQWLRKK
jgi:septal ring factor EnvC (AmiA/AmiB activator)